MAIVGKSMLECEMVLSTAVNLTEYHKLPVVNMFKEVMADVLQIDVRNS